MEANNLTALLRLKNVQQGTRQPRINAVGGLAKE